MKDSMSTIERLKVSRERYSLLTAHERTIFSLTGEGLSTKEVAAKINSNQRTVGVHIHNIMEKLDLEKLLFSALKLYMETTQ